MSFSFFALSQAYISLELTYKAPPGAKRDVGGDRRGERRGGKEGGIEDVEGVCVCVCVCMHLRTHVYMCVSEYACVCVPVLMITNSNVPPGGDEDEEEDRVVMGRGVRDMKGACVFMHAYIFKLKL